ncbi:MAG: M48 family metallopeptidase [Corallococcus sp.]|nr:M48 family metallopeptidase [Corallococcus sp.]
MGDVVNVSTGASGKTYLEGNTLFIPEKNYSDKTERLKAVRSYLRKVALVYVAGEISSYGASISLCPTKIEFRNLADCWTKCSQSSQKILVFDYRIAQLPQNLRTYIIAHAFAHFKYPAHDSNFWNCISNVLPRYKDYINKLEEYEFLKDL